MSQRQIRITIDPKPGAAAPASSARAAFRCGETRSVSRRTTVLEPGDRPGRVQAFLFIASRACRAFFPVLSQPPASDREFEAQRSSIQSRADEGSRSTLACSSACDRRQLGARRFPACSWGIALALRQRAVNHGLPIAQSVAATR
jgi:hypothetical protein